MKRSLWLGLVFAVSAMGIGCQTATDSSTPVVQESSGESTASESTASDFTLVRLNVPNMT